MKTRTLIPFVLVLFAVLSLSTSSHAQSPLVTIDTVTVGDAGNAADTTGFGAVGYVYRIGKFEITILQYTAFLNSAAKTDPYGLFNVNMASDTYYAGISRSGSDGAYTYSVIGPLGSNPPGANSPGNRPIAWISWFDAARFCNWLHNGATNGASTETGAYTLNGIVGGNAVAKNPEARWWIPTEDEWYKAAFYKSGGTNSGYWLYPTRSDTPPGNNINDLGATNRANYRINSVYTVTQIQTSSRSQNYLTDVGAFSNSASAYGTFDQGGNLWEWNDGERPYATTGTTRGGRGSHCLNNIGNLSLRSTSSDYWEVDYDYDLFGFRVATSASNSSTNIVLTVEKSTALSGPWRVDRDINVGPMTNTNEFYRLKIRTVVE
jgi:sulfatase modifying factor 1